MKIITSQENPYAGHPSSGLGTMKAALEGVRSEVVKLGEQVFKHRNNPAMIEYVLKHDVASIVRIIDGALAEGGGNDLDATNI